MDIHPRFVSRTIVSENVCKREQIRSEILSPRIYIHIPTGRQQGAALRYGGKGETDPIDGHTWVRKG